MEIRDMIYLLRGEAGRDREFSAKAHARGELPTPHSKQADDFDAIGDWIEKADAKWKAAIVMRDTINNFIAEKDFDDFTQDYLEGCAIEFDRAGETS